MFEKLGNKVVFLKRIKIGELPLDPDLPLGSCLEIMHKDVENLLKSQCFEEVFRNITENFSSYWINMQ